MYATMTRKRESCLQLSLLRGHSGSSRCMNTISRGIISSAARILVVGVMFLLLCGGAPGVYAQTDDLILFNDIYLWNGTNITNTTNHTYAPSSASVPVKSPIQPHKPYRTKPSYRQPTTLSPSSESGRAANSTSRANNITETISPTVSSTPSPTNTPTRKPTLKPTLAPSTVSPTLNPTTISPTKSPTDKPNTSAPTATGKVEHLRMALTYTNPTQTMTDVTQEIWHNATSWFVMEYWRDSIDRNNFTVQGLRVTTELVAQQITTSRRRRRKLQEVSSNNRADLEYRQTITYTSVTPDTDTTAPPDTILTELIATIPFKLLTSRNKYMASYLQQGEQGSALFANLQTVSQVIVSESDPNAIPATTPTDESNFFQDYWIWIAIGGGVVAFLIVIASLLCFRRRKNTDRRITKPKDFNRDEYFSNTYGNGINTASHSPHAQDDSTLNEPMPRLGMMSSGESIAGYGDQSVTTIDYDYTRAYGGGAGGGGQSVVSSASATLGGWTNPGTTGGGTIAGAGDNNTVFSDDASFHPYGGSISNNQQQQQQQQQQPSREELIDVICPPGKLGVVIDTPNDGPPQVHAIKDSSCVADKLRVGDKLVAVDQEDVRAMTAIKVSKMISRKSANPTRVLTILRVVD